MWCRLRRAQAYLGAFLKRPEPHLHAAVAGSEAASNAASHLYDIGTFAQVGWGLSCDQWSSITLVQQISSTFGVLLLLLPLPPTRVTSHWFPPSGSRHRCTLSLLATAQTRPSFSYWATGEYERPAW